MEISNAVDKMVDGNQECIPLVLDILREDIPSLACLNAVDWCDFVENTIYVYPYGNGGMCVTRDPFEKGLFWINAARVRFLPVEKFKAFLLLMSGLGVGVLAANTEAAPELSVFYELVGMQDLGGGVYSVRLNS